MLTAEKVNELVEQSLPSIIEGFKDEVRQSITYQVKEEVARLVSEHVREWVRANVLPEISEVLVEKKEGLISVAPAMAEAMVAGLVEAAKKALAEKLEHSWERRKIFEAMLG